MSRNEDDDPAAPAGTIIKGRDRVNSGPAGPRRRRGVIAWAIVGCVLLGASGAVRAVQDRRFAVERGYLAACPFPLKTLPTEVGDWRLVEGSDHSLDSLTTRITGATDHILRTYVDDLTGVVISVMVLFGPVEPVIPHTPQVCYPACGYTPSEEMSYREVLGSNGQKYLFKSGVYAKSGGRAILREASYYSFRLDGPWSPDAATGRRFPRRNPGIFKVQVQRRVAEGERREKDDPVEKFLERFMPEIDRKIAESQAATPGPGPTLKVEGSNDAAPIAPAR